MKKIGNSWFPTVTDTHILGFFGEYRWLSNFHMHPLTHRNIEFPSAEHAFQAMKSDDRVIWRHMATLPTAGEAKAWGRNRIKLRDGWVEDGIRDREMARILKAKFQDKELRKKLRATGDLILVETNYWGDTYWGSCRGSGKNQLGKLLMAVRDSLD